MTKSKFLLLVLILCGGFGKLFCQNNPLDQSIKDISSQIKPVKTADASIDQKLKLVKDNIVSIEIIKTDNKGKTSTQSYQFNLADINQAGVKEMLVGPVMYVEIPVKDNNKYIESSKDGKFDSYQSSVRITAYDVDNSRALINAIHGSISIAEKIELGKFNFSSQEEILTALYGAVKPTPDNACNQKIRSTADKKEKLDFTSISTKDNKTTMYEFNLADINPSKINVKISGFLGLFPGKSLSVSVETSGDQKVIKQFENDVPKTYVSVFNISPSDIENAKQIKNLLYLAIQNVKSQTTSLNDFSYSATASPGSNAKNNTSGQTNNTPSEASKNPAPAVSNSISDAEVGTPDFSNRPYYITSDKKLENLERADASTDVKVKGLGYGGHDMFFTAFPAKSIVTFKQGYLPKLVIKVENNQDPSELVTLTKAEKSKDRRRFLLESASMTGSARNVSSAKIQLQFRKIRDGIYEIILPVSLGEGQYAFMPIGSSVSLLSASTIKISCFDVE